MCKEDCFYDCTASTTVQVVPHITDAIQEWIERVAAVPVDGEDGPADVCVIEIGGTIGAGNFCLIHVSLVPILNVVGEQCIIWCIRPRRLLLRPALQYWVSNFRATFTEDKGRNYEVYSIYVDIYFD